MKKRTNILTKFCVIYNGYTIGAIVKARNIDDLFKRMNKGQSKNWCMIEYRDEDFRKIQICREFLDDQGMTIDEIIADWIEHNGDCFEDEIICCGSSFGNHVKF